MPKIKTLQSTYKGAHFTNNLNVNAQGLFSTRRPGNKDDWPGYLSLDITGFTSLEVEKTWHDAVVDLVDRKCDERKVIIVRFDSILRPNGKVNFFTDSEVMLVLKCHIANQITTVVDDKTCVKYEMLPEYDIRGDGLKQPFPWAFRFSDGDLKYPREDWTVVDWSQALEDTLVRACCGINAVVQMLHENLSTPEQLLAAPSLLRISAPAINE